MQSFKSLFENTQPPKESMWKKAGKVALGLGGAAALGGIAYGLGSGAINKDSIQNTYDAVKNKTSDMYNNVTNRFSNNQQPTNTQLPKPNATEFANQAAKQFNNNTALRNQSQSNPQAPVDPRQHLSVMGHQLRTDPVIQQRPNTSINPNAFVQNMQNSITNFVNKAQQNNN